MFFLDSRPNNRIKKGLEREENTGTDLMLIRHHLRRIWMIKADQKEKRDTQRRFQLQKLSEKHTSKYFHFVTEKKKTKLWWSKCGRNATRIMIFLKINCSKS